MGKVEYFLDNDLEISIEAKDMYELLHLLTVSFKEIVSNNFEGDTSENRELFFESESVDLIAVDYMNELIYLFDVYGFVPVRGVFNLFDRKVKAELFGFIVKREDIKRVLKAATLHQFTIQKKDGNIHLKMIVDL